ncbi:ADP-ribosylglycohydrolase family protein [Anaeromyxobacter paludicola]|uniref:ADP-ribosylglycohydrolase n=1 Tax=Anaeromyxobacter paludicola TaxID=2918171 RepID=A0ABM7XEC5_9BACT|nr:ADP-ribosylglycohydrolase family protein [Anaeromyxobacter paludicola]BDG10215.1 ADP-ribosylglycohydrolase [Anaeromyxobacter paludicola]
MTTANPPLSGPARSRARGALLGLAVGDALGTTLEFVVAPRIPFPALALGPHAEVVGGGPFSVAPGQVTDDTQMATCLATSLRARGGLDVADLAARYVAWLEHAFDAGAQTREVLGLLAGGAAPAEAGRKVWTDRGLRAAGNGSLMRTAPIGVAFALQPAARREAALLDSALTHYDPRCQLACAAFDAAIGAAVSGKARSPQAVLESARAELAPAAQAIAALPGLPEPLVEEARAALEEDLARAAQDDPGLYGPELHLHERQGFVRVAFRLAFWELLHAPDLRAGLVDVVNRGGDADTNGAIAGALLGALHGDGAIPEPWAARVLGALADEPGPLRDLYHPRLLLELVAG